MKKSKIILVALFSVILSLTTSAQTHVQGKKNMIQASKKIESFKVFGKCDMCKTRIEKTVKAEGATNASWDSKTQILQVKFDSSETSNEALSKKLATAGHDTEMYKVPDDVYANLPGCCHYERIK